MKRGKNEEVENDSMKELVSEKLRGASKSIAGFLNDRVNRLSESHKRISLLLFGFILGLICLAQIIRSVNAEAKMTTLTIEGITLPKDIHESTRKQKLQDVLRIKHLLDSLKETAVYDSLMIARPGLVDSVNLLIQHYQ